MPRTQSDRRLHAQPRRFHRISVHELGRPKARIGNPNTGIPEVTVQPLSDIYFVTIATAMPLPTLFTIPVGQNYNFGGVASFAKNFGHTNLVQAGMLEIGVPEVFGERGHAAEVVVLPNG